MAGKPLVSIIIITYKKYENLFGVLNSVFAQDYSNLELILQDDGSDNFIEYQEDIEQYILNHKSSNVKNVIVNHLLQNVGTSKNVNAGIAIANGKYVKLLTADDTLYDTEVISNCVDFCEEHDTRILVGQTYVLRKEGMEEDEVEDNILYRWKARSGRKCTLMPPTRDIRYLSSLSTKKCNELLASRCIISTISVFYRMDIFDETGGFLEEYRLVEDMPFWPYLAQRGELFSFAPIRMVKYKLDGISNGGPLNSEFHTAYCSIMKNIYISNEVRGGILNGYLKKVRKKEIEWIDITRNIRKTSLGIRFKYFDVMIYSFYHKVKYLIIGSKL